MNVAQLDLHNFQCFAGKQSLVLGPKAYGIFARHVTNPERSNWLGKTTLLEAIRFVLTGEHQWRLEDQWITNGEKGGGVAVCFDDGRIASRSRVRGKSTILSFDGARGDVAQAALYQAIGLGRDDLFATCQLEQGQMAGFVTKDPADRLKMVSAWLRLAPLEEAEQVHRDAAGRLLADIELLAERQRRAQAMGDAAANERQLVGCSFEDLEKKIATARAAHDKALGDIERNEARHRAREKLDERLALIEDGKRVRAELDAINEPAVRNLHQLALGHAQKTHAAATALGQQVQDRRKTAQGKFDGRCPVANLECPAKKQINAMRVENDDALTAVLAQHAQAVNAHAQSVQSERNALARVQEVERLRHKLDGMRERVLTMPKTDLGEPEDRAVLRARHEHARQELERLVAENQVLHRVHRQELEAGREATALQHKLDELNKRLATEREAAQVFGKNGAQREVAERALARVQDGANDRLAQCDVGLSVMLRWSREGKDAAKTCEACGQPFPASVREKTCARCGAERGKHLVHKLDVELSNVSGAAKDLAGFALQLSAAEWLKRTRLFRWSQLLVDEPFGQLDKHHRGSLGRHLSSLMRSCSFDQSLIVAHHSDVLEALPGRIDIVGDGRRSTVTVTA